MKRIVSAIILVLALFPLQSIPASAVELQISCPGGGSYEIVMPSGVALNGQSCTGNLAIDSRVKIVGKDAFFLSKIDSVQIPDSVTSIDANAFITSSLKKITLGNSLESIGFSAFRDGRFESISLPSSLKSIGELAFYGTVFTSIQLPNSLISIGSGAFARDTRGVPLKYIEIPDSVVNIGAEAFWAAGLENIKIGKSVTEIRQGTFQNNKLTKVDIPGTLGFIGGYAFKNNPIEIVNFSEGLVGIDYEAFEGTKIVSLQLPESAVKIRERAFANIKSLKSVTIGKFLGIRQADGTYAVGDIFESSYAIERVDYCGDLKGFIVTPVCTLTKARADNNAAILKIKLEAEAMEALELKTKQDSEAKQAIEAVAKQKAIEEMLKAKQEAAAKAAAMRKITIICVKGKLTKKITAIKPVCPAGYKKK